MQSFAIKNLDIKTIKIDKLNSFIKYHMVHPLHSWDGISNQIEGFIQLDDIKRQVVKVDLVAKVSSFDSKNSKRDARMMEITEALKYPNVSFVSSTIKEDGDNLEVIGIIVFHGISKEVKFKAKREIINKQTRVSGDFIVLLEDFKIDRPSLLTMKTENEMKMSFLVQYAL
jgi:polyisoprenoid-binding protein YceI